MSDAEIPDLAGEAGTPDVDALQAEIARLREESEQRLAGWQRAQADFENLKKRTQRDIIDQLDRAQRAIFLELVGIADDFQRALDADAETGPAGWRDGVQLIAQKLQGLLERHQVRPIAAQGQQFDPNFHEAVAQAPGPDGQVVSEVQQGYLIRDRVLRPGRVIVGTGGEPPDGPPVSQDGPQDTGTDAARKRAEA